MWVKALSPFTHLCDRNNKSDLEGAEQSKGSRQMGNSGLSFHSCAGATSKIWNRTITQLAF